MAAISKLVDSLCIDGTCIYAIRKKALNSEHRHTASSTSGSLLVNTLKDSFSVISKIAKTLISPSSSSVRQTYYKIETGSHYHFAWNSSFLVHP